MADNVTTQSSTLATIPDSTTIATDDAGAGGHVQVVKLAVPTNGAATAWGDATDGLPVEITNASIAVTGSSDEVWVQVTPTISTSIYASGDNVGGEIEFTNAVATSGGTGMVLSCVLADKDAENAPLELHLFDRAISGTHTDNSAFDPTDGDLANKIGVIKIDAADYNTFADNSSATKSTTLPIKSNATSIYGYLVVRSTPTYTSTTDLIVTLHIVRN